LKSPLFLPDDLDKGEVWIIVSVEFLSNCPKTVWKILADSLLLGSDTPRRGIIEINPPQKP